MNKFLLLIAIIFTATISFATGINKPVSSRYGFIENKGQIIDQNNNLNPSVKYLFNSNGLNIQLLKNSFSYDTYKRKPLSNSPQGGENSNAFAMSGGKSPLRGDIEGLGIDSIFFHRVDIEFIGANANPQIIAEQPSADYINYYTTGTPEGGITNVRTYQTVTYINLYNGIDLQFTVDQTGKPKYNFIVHPGADATQIHWKYNGAFNSKLDSEKITLVVASGNFEEQIPNSYIQENSQSLKVKYVSLNENEYSFNTVKYDDTKTLIIDPVPWATYYGGSGDEWGFGITTDTLGNVLTTGATTSLTSIATAGAFQTTYGGGTTIGDAYILKLNSNGVRQWATYYGGSNSENGYGIVTDLSGNIIVTGTTYSNGISTSGAFQTTFGGASDAFIIKLNSSGICQWATYFGGSGSDAARSVCLDQGGNILFVGGSSSTSGISTIGVTQTVMGGYADVIVAKFSTSGNRIWAGYCGGSTMDQGYGIATDASSNAIITGFALSATGISTTGSFQPVFGGGSNFGDAFVVKYNSSGIRQWGTYFGGSLDENGQSVATDFYGNIYVTGQTVDTGLATIGAYQNSIVVGGGYRDAYIVKFDPSGSRLWSTYFGGSSDDNGLGITTDASGNVLICGYTYSPTSIATAGTYQTSLMGGFNYGDGFIAKFSSSGSRLWSTYFGGIGDEYVDAITIDIYGRVLISGYTLSTTGIATVGAYQATFAGGTTYGDAFIAAFTAIGGLPVELINFDAQLDNNNQVLCTWQTASELNNDYFEVQRSEVGSQKLKDWKAIGKVKGNGTTNAVSSYQFTDNGLSTVNLPDRQAGRELSTIYYRLKQIDFDGKSSFSEVRAIHLGNDINTCSVYPNPNTGTFTINFNNTQGEKQIAIYNLQGKLVANYTTTESVFEVQEMLAHGMYFIKTETQQGLFNTKFVVE